MLVHRGIIGKQKYFLDAQMIRTTVFTKEQKFCPLLEFDKIDQIAYHSIFYYNQKPIGTGRTFQKPGHNNIYQLGRVAVLKPYRKLRIGSKIMEELEKYAKSQGCNIMELSAQVRAKDFYYQHGYREVGEEYLDEWCPHIQMIKKL